MHIITNYSQFDASDRSQAFSLFLYQKKQSNIRQLVTKDAVKQKPSNGRIILILDLTAWSPNTIPLNVLYDPASWTKDSHRNEKTNPERYSRDNSDMSETDNASGNTESGCNSSGEGDSSSGGDGESSGDDDDSEPATPLIQLNANILNESKSKFACYTIPPEIVNIIRNHTSSDIVIFVPVTPPPKSAQKYHLFVKWLLVLAFALCFIWIFASPSIEPFVGIITTLAAYLQLD